MQFEKVSEGMFLGSSLFPMAGNEWVVDKRDSVGEYGSPLPFWKPAATCGGGFMHQDGSEKHRMLSRVEPLGSKNSLRERFFNG